MLNRRSFHTPLGCLGTRITAGLTKSRCFFSYHLCEVFFVSLDVYFGQVREFEFSIDRSTMSSEWLHKSFKEPVFIQA